MGDEGTSMEVVENKERTTPAPSTTQLPPGWSLERHTNGLYFYYHQETAVISWSRPYTRDIQQIKDHEPPLEVFQVLLEGNKKPLKTMYKEPNPQTTPEDPPLDPKLPEPSPPSPSPASTPSPSAPCSAEVVRDNLVWLVAEVVRREKRRKKVNEGNGDDKKWKKKMELSPEGKSPVTFLHEYTHHILKKTLFYESSVQDDGNNPFLTKVYVDGSLIASGSWTNKRLSKQVAAFKALSVLCPDVYPKEPFQKMLDHKYVDTDTPSSTKNLKITDERLLSADGNEKTPAQLLQEYCNREDINLKLEVLENKDNEAKFNIRITVQNWSAEASGKSKKEAKQKASQEILRLMYPNFKTWGEFLKHEDEEKEIHKSKAPNASLLQKLKLKMLQKYPLSGQPSLNFEPYEDFSKFDTTLPVQKILSDTDSYQPQFKKRKLDTEPLLVKLLPL